MAGLKLSIVFPSGGRIGPGKRELLRRIEETGSISAAARDMKMSYKRAWLLIESMNVVFLKPVVIAAPGGRRGGGARLTPLGARVLARLDRLEAQALKAVGRDLKAVERMARRSE